MSSPSHGRRGRAAFILNATVSVALLGLIAAVALVVKAPSPPGIAEFAPQAARPITKAPLNQSSTNGAGAGACTGAQKCEGPKKPKPAVSLPPVTDVLKGVPSALQCYTWPDGSVTQTSDPQSPPCVANWPDADKGNGGPTSLGVTANQIRVAYPQDDTGKFTSQLPKAQRLVDFLNSHFQLYGRKIVLAPFPSAMIAQTHNTGIAADPQSQHADAVAAAALKPFAALDFLDYTNGVWTLPAYRDTLAAKHVITTISGRASWGTDQQLAAHAPYEWSYQATNSRLLRATASMICTTLKGKNATHSGSYTTTPRKFGLLLPDSTTAGGDVPGLGELKARLAACGITDLPTAYYDDASRSSDSTATSTNVNALLSLRQAGVTSVIYYVWGSDAGSSQPLAVAKNARYSPEWVAPVADGWFFAGAGVTPNREVDHLFGVIGSNRFLDDGGSPWGQAYTAAGGDLAQGFYTGRYIYQELLLLASGIQMAGPRLTPESFAQGLKTTSFPNPQGGGAPLYEGVANPADDYAMLGDDFEGVWVDPSAGAQVISSGGVTLNPYRGLCYLDLGRRYGIDSWPSEDRFFKGRCR